MTYRSGGGHDGSLGFSPLWLVLAVPLAAFEEAWVWALAAFCATLALLFVRAWFEHRADLRREKRRREMYG